jgi:hypothetical protein
MKKSILVLSLVCLALAGCSAAVGPVAQYDGLEPNKDGQEPHAIDAKHLIVTIPEWAGAVKSAQQVNEGTVTRQTISIPRDGSDGYEIEVQIETRESVSRNAFRLRAPTTAEIYEELRHKFPGIEMHIIARRPGDTFDMAIGRGADGTRCLYAWRWEDDIRAALDRSGIAAVRSFISQQTLAASLRIRLCNRYTTLDDLASLARQIRFNPSANLDQMVLGSVASQADAPITSANDVTLENSSFLSTQTQARSLESQTSGPQKFKRKKALQAERTVEHGELPAAPLSSGIQAPRYLAPLPTGLSTVVPSNASNSTTSPHALDLPAAALRGPPSQAGGAAATTTEGH